MNSSRPTPEATTTSGVGVAFLAHVLGEGTRQRVAVGVGRSRRIGVGERYRPGDCGAGFGNLVFGGLEIRVLNAREGDDRDPAVFEGTADELRSRRI